MTHLNPPNRPDRASPLFDWLSYLGSLHVSAIDMGLSRVMPVADALGITGVNDQVLGESKPYIFTVAGTNGKGSTTATIAKVCELAGYKTALYQSPHVVSFTERVKINDVQATEAELIDAFIAVDDARISCDLSLSFFEMTTLAAMLIFKQADCDVWVLEIGLGGRLDVVNIIDPDIAVITNVGVDHVDWLGDDVNKIGFEKAGILRNGIPCVLGSDSLPPTVHERASELNCQAFLYQQDYAWTLDQHEANDTWIYSNQAVTMTLPMPSLALENVSAAITAVLASSLDIWQQHVEQAMTQTKLIGRFQIERYQDSTLVFDAAHNPDGVAFLLRKFLPFYQRFSQESSVQPELHIVFSMLADKDMTAVVASLSEALPQAHWHIAPLDPSIKRAASIEQFSEAFSTVSSQSHREIDCKQYKHLADAMVGATLHSENVASGVVLVCGSFHTIAEAMMFLEHSETSD